ncbi:c-type cytochrome [Massilia aurea]|uniref:c-type cytochrome n=1 Tax=Massilia aurea TaxID=373040 RepID=UPI0034626E9E
MRALIMATALLLGDQALAAPSQAQVDSGRRLFARCAGCHDTGPGARNGFGPQLNAVVGRKAGSAAGYAYSPALKASSLVWSEQNLVAFIRDSEKVVPGNKMRFLSFMSEKQAADIVAYLRVHGVAAPPPRR